jgi:hypothetical protein
MQIANKVMCRDVNFRCYILLLIYGLLRAVFPVVRGPGKLKRGSYSVTTK